MQFAPARVIQISKLVMRVGNERKANDRVGKRNKKNSACADIDIGLEV